MSCQYFMDTLPILYLCQYLYTFILDLTLQWKWKEKNMSMYILVQYFQQRNRILGDRKYYLACGWGVVLVEPASRCTRWEHLVDFRGQYLVTIFKTIFWVRIFVLYLFIICTLLLNNNDWYLVVCSAHDAQFLEILNKLTNFVAWNSCRADFYLRVINIFYVFLMWNC